MNELLEEYGLSPIEAKDLVKRVAQFKEDQQSGARDNGQIVKQVVAFGEPAGKRIRDCKLVPVNLTMYFNGEEKLEKETGLSHLKKIKVHQLAWEDYQQGGLLSYEDIESILGISTSIIKRYVKQYREKDIVVPTRGQIEDIGPGITHKEKIIELLIRTLTGYSESLIDNYIKLYTKYEIEHPEALNNILERFHRYLEYGEEKNQV